MSASSSRFAWVRRVAVIGCSGSGKTTLANELGSRLQIPVVHIDSHYWQVVGGERVESTPEQGAACHRQLIAEDAWVIDGMKFGVLDERLALADTVIYLDLPTSACLSGIARRRLRYRGQMRPDLGIYDRITGRQLRWVWFFRRRHRPVVLDKVAQFRGRQVRPAESPGQRAPARQRQTVGRDSFCLSRRHQIVADAIASKPWSPKVKAFVKHWQSRSAALETARRSAVGSLCGARESERCAVRDATVVRAWQV